MAGFSLHVPRRRPVQPLAIADTFAAYRWHLAQCLSIDRGIGPEDRTVSLPMGLILEIKNLPRFKQPPQRTFTDRFGGIDINILDLTHQRERDAVAIEPATVMLGPR